MKCQNLFSEKKIRNISSMCWLAGLGFNGPSQHY